VSEEKRGELAEVEPENVLKRERERETTRRKSKRRTLRL